MAITIGGLRVPEDTDPSNVPQDIQALATGIDTRLSRIAADEAALSGFTGMSAGDRAVVVSTRSQSVYTGTAWVGHNTSWVTVASPASGWSAFSGQGFAGPVMYRRVNKMIFLAGTISGGSAGTLFTLPEGFKPAAPRLFSPLSSGTPATVRVGADGQVSVTALGSGGSGFVGLAQVRFQAER